MILRCPDCERAEMDAQFRIYVQDVWPELHYEGRGRISFDQSEARYWCTDAMDVIAGEESSSFDYMVECAGCGHSGHLRDFVGQEGLGGFTY